MTTTRIINKSLIAQSKTPIALNSTTITEEMKSAFATRIAAETKEPVLKHSLLVTVGRLANYQFDIATTQDLDISEEEKHMIDNGGSGDVFKGRLGGINIAFKRRKEPEHKLLFRNEDTIYREIQRTNNLGPYVVGYAGQAYDSRKPDYHGLIMEWVPYPNMGRWMSSNLAKAHSEYLPSCYKILTNAADALACFHEAGFIHRDIKPGNFLINEKTCQVKLIDFGHALKMGKRNFIREHDQVGTSGYTAPESQWTINGSFISTTTIYSNSSDVFSLGVVMYVMLQRVTLIYPNMELKFSHEYTTNHQELISLILECLECYADKRPQAREIHRRLQLFSKQYSETATSSQTALHSIEPSTSSNSSVQRNSQ